MSILWPPTLQDCKLLISDLKSFLSGKTSKGKYPSNLAEITLSQISTPSSSKDLFCQSRIYISLLQVQYASKKLQGALRKENKLHAGT